MTKVEKIKGGIFGLVIGDALGVHYEFKPPTDIPPYDQIEYIPPKGYKASYPRVPYATWSDDSAQALCLLDSLIESDGFNLDNFANKLSLWYTEGLWAVDNIVFDCGMQTCHALEQYLHGTPPTESGFINPDGKGNGALMRVLPLIFWNTKDFDELILMAHKQCLVTHGHICNQVCCALYCLWGRMIFLGSNIKDSYYKAVDYLKQFYISSNLDEYLCELDILLQDRDFKGGGFVVDSFCSVRHLLFTYNSYESVIKEAIRLGNDTDTTAAIAGGLAGTFYGYENIPKRFTDNLRDYDKVLNIVNKFCTILF